MSTQQIKKSIENLVGKKINNSEIFVSLDEKSFALFGESEKALFEAYGKIKDMFKGDVKVSSDDEEVMMLIGY